MSENSGYIYAPYIFVDPIATIVNGVVIWDKRRWINWWYQVINQVIPKRRRIIKNFEELSKRKIEVPIKYATF